MCAWVGAVAVGTDQTGHHCPHTKTEAQEGLESRDFLPSFPGNVFASSPPASVAEASEFMEFYFTALQKEKKNCKCALQYLMAARPVSIISHNDSIVRRLPAHMLFLRVRGQTTV